MPKGFIKGVYVSDRGERFWLYVDADQALDTNRGWAELGAEPLLPFPSYGFPRFVRGLDVFGNEQRARIATVQAPLWTGQAIGWIAETTDQGTVGVSRTARVGERIRR